MKPEDEKALMEVVTRAKTRVAGLQVTTCGLLLICAALRAFKGMVMPEITWSEVASKDWRPPKNIENPLGRLFTDRFFRPDVTAADLRLVNSWEALDDLRFQDPGHLHLRLMCIMEASAFMAEAGRAPQHPTAQKHHYYYRCVLASDKFGGADPIVVAQKNVESIWEAKKHIVVKFPRNWRQSSLQRNVLTPLGEYLALEGQPYDEKAGVKKRRGARLVTSSKVSEVYRVPRGARHRADSAMLLSVSLLPRELCRGQLCEIIRQTVARSNQPVYTVLALSIVTFQSPRDLLCMKEVPALADDGSYKSWREFRPLHKAPASNSFLPSNQKVPIFWPYHLASRYLSLSVDDKLSKISSAEISAALKGICPTATWNKIRICLVRHGSIWFDLPWVWTVLAAYPGVRPPAPVHYIRTSLGLHQLKNFISLFSP